MTYEIIFLLILHVIIRIISGYFYEKEIKALKERLKDKEKEYNDLTYEISRNEYNEVEKFNKNILLTKVTLKKIQKNYTVRKSDKLILIDFYHKLMNYTKKDILIYDIKLGKKYTYKDATNVILNYLRNEKSENLSDVLNALLYLIFK